MASDLDKEEPPDPEQTRKQHRCAEILHIKREKRKVSSHIYEGGRREGTGSRTLKLFAKMSEICGSPLQPSVAEEVDQTAAPFNKKYVCFLTSAYCYRTGSYLFRQDERGNQYFVIMKDTTYHWKSRNPKNGFDDSKMFPEAVSLLSNTTTGDQHAIYNILVGEKRVNNGFWNGKRLEIVVANTRALHRDHKVGCKRKSEICENTTDTFVNLTMISVGVTYVTFQKSNNKSGRHNISIRVSAGHQVKGRSEFQKLVVPLVVGLSVLGVTILCVVVYISYTRLVNRIAKDRRRIELESNNMSKTCHCQM
ncbi:unnamed protein product [Lactuca saligna]|uniref:Uncharacterized protein n=1 Tax=Lactuca saligna TaxID=75948 RepID=A0AA35YP06_LACSI|nr:unnamed protein product [Lactuca saligna]